MNPSYETLSLLIVAFVLLMALLVVCLAAAYLFTPRMPAGITHRYTREHRMQRVAAGLFLSGLMLAVGLFLVGYLFGSAA